MSFGGLSNSAATQAVIDEAVAEGLILVAAAGNMGRGAMGQFPFYPAAYDGVIAVAATDLNRERASYSSYYPQVDIAAPGGDSEVDLNEDGQVDGIYAGVLTTNDDQTAFQADYAFYQGTSMASPHVAAGVALMKAIAPNLTHDDIQAYLTNGLLTVDDGLAPGHENELGFGVMSLSDMAAAAQDFVVSGAPEPKTVLGFSPSPLDFGTDLTVIRFGVGKLGDAPLSITGFEGDGTFGRGEASRLLLAADETADDGLGRYRLFLDRVGLEPGVLEGRVGFQLSNGEVSYVPVRATIGEADPNTAPLLVRLEQRQDDGSFSAVDTQTVESGLTNLGLELDFPELPAGAYRLIYGTDMDNDGVICDGGELCGRYPPAGAASDVFTADAFDVVLALDYAEPPADVVAPQ